MDSLTGIFIPLHARFTLIEREFKRVSGSSFPTTTNRGTEGHEKRPQMRTNWQLRL